MTTRRPRCDDSGFTLLELLIVIVVIGIVTIPFGNVVLTYFTNTTTTSARLNESHGAQMSATYFAQDAASFGTRASAAPSALLAQSIWTNVAAGAGPFPCGSSGTDLLLMVGDDVVTPGSISLGHRRVAYLIENVSGQTQLHRLACAGSATIISDIDLADDVDPQVSPAVTCAIGGTEVACAGTGAQAPHQVSLTLSLTEPTDAGNDYDFVLTGQRVAT